MLKFYHDRLSHFNLTNSTNPNISLRSFNVLISIIFKSAVYEYTSQNNSLSSYIEM